MTFPIQTEGTIRKRILDICQSHAREVVEIARVLAQMTDSAVDGSKKKMKDHYASIVKLLTESEKTKTALLEEVASVGSLLISREDFLRLIFKMGEIGDYAEALAFRLEEIAERKSTLGRSLLDGISGLIGLVLEETVKVRDTLMLLSLNPSKALELSKMVEEVERKVDSSSRSMHVQILNSKLQVPTMLLLRDIVDRAEQMADIGQDVVDLIRVLALTS